MLQQYYFELHLSRNDYLPYYQGQIQNIVVTTELGLRVQFPAMHLRQFVTETGVHGRFQLQTQNNKFFSLSKIR